MIELFSALVLAALAGSLSGVLAAKAWYKTKLNNALWVQQHLEIKAMKLRNELDQSNKELVSLRLKHRKLLLGKVNE